MKNTIQTKEQLLKEIDQLKANIARLEKSELKYKNSEERLRESEEKYRAAFSTSPDAVNINSLNGLYVEVNNGFTQLTGFTRKDVTGRSSAEINIWAIPGDREKLIKGLKEKGEVINLESQFRCKDGSLKTALMSSSIINLNNEPHVLSITRDITERKKVELDLKESENKYRSIFNNSHTVMMIVDPNSATIIDANPAACHYYGWSAEEFKGKNVAEINTLSKDAILKEMASAKSEGRNHFQFQHRLASGEIRGVEVYSGPIEIGGKSLLYSIIHDITEREKAKEKVNQLNQQLLRAEEIANFGFLDWDLSTNEIYLSPEINRIYGIPADVINVAEFISKVVHPEDVEFVNENLRLAIKGIKEYNIDHRIIRPDGTIVWLNARAELIKDENRKPIRLLGTILDITERKEAEEEKRRGMEKYKVLITVSNTGAWEYHQDTDFLWCSPEYFSMLGRDISQFDLSGVNNLKETWIDLLHPEDRQRASTHFSNYLENGSVGMYESYFRLKHSDGHWVWILSRGNTLRDESGKITDITVGTHIDISDSKKAEEEIKRSEKRLEVLHKMDQAILESRSVGSIANTVLQRLHKLSAAKRISIALFDEDEKNANVYSHGVLEKKLGQARKVPVNEVFRDIKGMRTGKVIEEKDLSVIRNLGQLMLQMRESGIQSTFSIPMLARGKLLGSINLGFDMPHGYSKEDLELGKEVADTLAIALEQASLHEKLAQHTLELEERVTERTARLQTANQELESFAYSVSHDLRAPLRAINGFSEIISEKYESAFPKEAIQYFNYIRESALSMSQLIQDLLKLSRLIKATGRRESIDLQKLVGDSIRNLDTEIREQNAKIMLPETFPHFVSDRTLLGQIFQNLIQNAIKYHSEGMPPVVHLSFEEVGNSLILKIKDNGIGIPKQQQQKVFEVFQRLHKHEKYPGTGIGLALVKKAVDKLGGEIKLESIPGKGSTFIVSLPKTEMED